VRIHRDGVLNLVTYSGVALGISALLKAMCSVEMVMFVEKHFSINS